VRTLENVVGKLLTRRRVKKTGFWMVARGGGFDGGVTGVWTVGGFRAQWSGACPEMMAGDDWV